MCPAEPSFFFVAFLKQLSCLDVCGHLKSKTTNQTSIYLPLIAVTYSDQEQIEILSVYLYLRDIPVFQNPVDAFIADVIKFAVYF